MIIFRFLNNYQELKPDPESEPELTRLVAAPGKKRLLGGSGSATLVGVHLCLIGTGTPSVVEVDSAAASAYLTRE